MSAGKTLSSSPCLWSFCFFTARETRSQTPVFRHSHPGTFAYDSITVPERHSPVLLLHSSPMASFTAMQSFVLTRRGAEFWPQLAAGNLEQMAGSEPGSPLLMGNDNDNHNHEWLLVCILSTQGCTSSSVDLQFAKPSWTFPAASTTCSPRGSALCCKPRLLLSQ